MENKKLSKKQRQVLIGILLGDASLQPNKQKTKYTLSILQSGKHKQYVFHLYEIFKDFVNTVPKKYVFEYSDKRFPDKMYTRWSFKTKCLKIFKFYGHAFYIQKKKNST